MSYTEIYGFDRNGDAYPCAKVNNAWRGAMAVWRIMEGRHLPPAPYSRLMNPIEAKAVWKLCDDKSVPEHERIVMLSTMDKCLVKKENLPRLIEAFRKFEGDTSLPEQADIMEGLLADDDCIAVGWNQTSVSTAVWSRYDEEADEENPYNCLHENDHFWLFDDLDGKGGDENV